MLKVGRPWAQGQQWNNALLGRLSLPCQGHFLDLSPGPWHQPNPHNHPFQSTNTMGTRELCPNALTWKHMLSSASGSSKVLTVAAPQDGTPGAL